VEEWNSVYDSLYFFTTNPKEGMKTERYLWVQKDEGSPTNLYSINIPDISHLNRNLAVPFIIHEMAHSIRTGDSMHQRRNRTLRQAVVTHIRSEVCIFIKNTEPEKANDEKVSRLISERLTLCDTFNAGTYSLSAARFAEKLIELLNKMVNSTNNIDSEDKTLYYALKSLSMQEIVTDFKDIIIEARADMMMCCICGLNVRSYLECHHSYNKNNLIKYAAISADNITLPRVAAVLKTLMRISTKGALNIKDYPRCTGIREFVRKVEDEMHREADIIAIIAEYLTALSEHINKKLKEALASEDGGSVDSFNKTLELFKHDKKLNCSEQVTRLYAEWYRSLGDFIKNEPQ
jgi:hypothetical protein